MSLQQLYQLSLAEAAQGLRQGLFSVAELARAYDRRREETEPLLNAFITLKKPSLAQRADALSSEMGPSPLWGMPGGIKDNICTVDLPTTCASLSLENFVSPYAATAIRRLEGAGYLCVGKTNLDEFAMGSSTETSVHGPTRNPWDLGTVPGGSSGGSAAAVAAGQVAFALGSDTGGSVRQPASFCGVVGFKPTYGLVSRYGLVAYASSLDQIGIFTRTVGDVALVLDELAGHDVLDATSAPRPSASYRKAFPRDLAGVRIGVPEECFELSMQPGVKEGVHKALQTMADQGAIIESCRLPHMPHALAVYRVVAAAEASSNLARIDGVVYGRRQDGATVQEMIRSSRGHGLGEEVKRRLLLGTFALSRGQLNADYHHAQCVRTLICQDYQSAFSRFDVLACPTTPTVAFRLGQSAGETMGLNEADLFTAPVNLAGLPAISVPCDLVSDLPVGLQLIGAPFQEKKLLGIAQAYEARRTFDGGRRGPLGRCGVDFRGL